MSSSSREALENWLKTIKVPAGSKVIDIGGAQKPVKDRLGHPGEGSKYTILDLETPHEGGRVDITGDIEDKFFIPSEDNFDIAFCLEVSEYWLEPVEAIENIYKLLRPGGTLYISFHFVYPPHKPDGLDCLRYTDSGVIRLLGQAGFDQIEITHRRPKNPELLAQFYHSEGMKPLGGELSIGCLVKATKK